MLSPDDSYFFGYPVPDVNGAFVAGARELGWAWYDARRNDLLRETGCVVGHVVQRSLTSDRVPASTLRELAQEARSPLAIAVARSRSRDHPATQRHRNTHCRVRARADCPPTRRVGWRCRTRTHTHDGNGVRGIARRRGGPGGRTDYNPSRRIRCGRTPDVRTTAPRRGAQAGAVWTTVQPKLLS